MHFDKKNQQNRAQLAGIAYNLFCPRGNKHRHRYIAFKSFMDDYDNYPSFTFEYGLSQAKNADSILLRLQQAKASDEATRLQERKISDLHEFVAVEFQVHHNKIIELERTSVNHINISGGLRIQLLELEKQLAVANQKLVDSEHSHAKSMKTMRRRFWIGISIGLVGLASKFGIFDATAHYFKKLYSSISVENQMFGQSHPMPDKRYPDLRQAIVLPPRSRIEQKNSLMPFKR